MKEEIKRLVGEIGADEVQKKLGVTRQVTWELTSGKERSTWKIYLYALRYLRFLPALRRTKAFREYMADNSRDKNAGKES